MGGRGQGQGGRLPRRPDGLRRPLSRRQQRGPHGDRRGAPAEAPAHPLGHPLRPHHVGDRRRRGRRPAPPDQGDDRAPRAGRRRLAPGRVRQRPPDHAVPPGAREGDRAVPREERAGHDEARHRTRVRRQGRPDRAARPGPVRREDLPREARRGPAREEPDPHEDLQPAAARRRPDRRGVHGPGVAARAARRRHRRACSTEGCRTASTSCSKARRGRCSTSTTGRIRSSRRRTRSPGTPWHRPGIGPQRGRPRDRHREGLRHARGRRAVPHRGRGRDRRTSGRARATSSGP